MFTSLNAYFLKKHTLNLYYPFPSTSHLNFLKNKDFFIYIPEYIGSLTVGTFFLSSLLISS